MSINCSLAFFVCINVSILPANVLMKISEFSSILVLFSLNFTLHSIAGTIFQVPFTIFNYSIILWKNINLVGTVLLFGRKCPL